MHCAIDDSNVTVTAVCVVQRFVMQDRLIITFNIIYLCFIFEDLKQLSPLQDFFPCITGNSVGIRNVENRIQEK